MAGLLSDDGNCPLPSSEFKGVIQQISKDSTETPGIYLNKREILTVYEL